MDALLKTYKRLPVELERGEGVYVFDSAGRRYLDLYAGHAVTSTGHCHPRVVRAIQDQAAKLIFYSNAAGLRLREQAASLLIRHAPRGLTQVLFANSGAEANENALKMARRHTGRTEVVAMAGGFHGRTAGAMSVTGIEKYRRPSAPLLPGVTFVPFGDLAAAEAAVSDRTAAVILEPIQSMAGVKTAPAEYFAGLRKLCDRSGALLIYDEVQTGIGRTGTMFFAGRDGVLPDLVTLAKGIASGVPLSAVLVSAPVAEKIGYGEFGTTFGAGPLAMAALKATLETIEDERLLENVTRTSLGLTERLARIPGVIEVRGLGFLLGLKVAADAAKVQEELFRRGVIVGTADEPGVLRLLPPLTLKPHDAEPFVDILGPAIEAVTAR
ncbi:MAG: aminotransferase class III-fold pyridoxal phosphate-dependent enzyme [Planctomycetes bacterium]|nr:aminotransferase class III-fold pyridoxal phosphate-dependent enzyme [Planctomycetota bacterium]